MGRFEKIACTANRNDLALQGLSKLEQLLLRRMPQSVHMHILCRIALKQKFPKLTLVEFYRYVNENSDDADTWHNDPENDSFIVCIQKPNNFSKKGVLFLPPANPITDDMIKTFDNFIGWDTPQLFNSVPEPFSEVIRDLCISHKNVNKDGSEGITSTFMAMLDIEKAKSMDTTFNDPTITLKDLDLKYVPEIVASWEEWSEDHTAKVIEESVKTLGGVGAITDEEELASSVTLSVLGEMSILYTPERFRRRGLGELVIRGMSKKIATEFEMPPYGEVLVENVASQGLFRKLKFQEIFKTKLIHFVPALPPAGTTS